MSSDQRRPSRRRAPVSAGAPRIGVDRVACSGHGICAQTLADVVGLDEWGYPIVADRPVEAKDADLAVKLCPARALYLRP
ncbi:MAG: ferredoxin [Tetrasphaera sp.]|nr:ferredoxin [Tetrasphaera sp.]